MTTATSERRPSLKAIARMLIAAWERREACETFVERWRPIRTDGWSIVDGSECLVTRLPMVATVALNGRRFRNFPRELIQELESELRSRNFDAVSLLPPYPVYAVTQIELERAWEIRVAEPSAQGDYFAVAEKSVRAWLRHEAADFCLNYLDIEVGSRGMAAAGECVVARAPGFSDLALISSKRYRRHGSAVEVHRSRVRDAARRALETRGLTVREVRPSPDSRRLVRVADLVAGWTRIAPRLVIESEVAATERAETPSM